MEYFDIDSMKDWQLSGCEDWQKPTINSLPPERRKVKPKPTKTTKPSTEKKGGPKPVGKFKVGGVRPKQTWNSAADAAYSLFLSPYTFYKWVNEGKLIEGYLYKYIDKAA